MKKYMMVVGLMVLAVMSYSATVSIEIPADKVAPLVAALSERYPQYKWDNATNKIISAKAVLIEYLKNVERDYRRNRDVQTGIENSMTNTVDNGIAK